MIYLKGIEGYQVFLIELLVFFREIKRSNSSNPLT